MKGDITDIEQEKDQFGGHAAIPLPRRAPHRHAPQGTGQQGQSGKDRPDRRHGLGGRIGQRMAEDQAEEAGDPHGGIDGQTHPGRRHVDIHDPHRIALLIILRRGKAQVKPPHEQRRRQTRQPRPQGARHTRKALRIGEEIDHDPHIGGLWFASKALNPCLCI